VEKGRELAESLGAPGLFKTIGNIFWRNK